MEDNSSPTQDPTGRARSRSWVAAQTAFDLAATWFVDNVALVGGRWDDPALGVWTVRDLVGHTSRSLLTVESYLQESTSEVTVAPPVDYYQRVLGSSGDPASVAQRGRDAGIALGADIPLAVREIAERVVERVRAAAADDTVATPVGVMRLADYLPTRTFELTVHTCDVSVTLERPPDVPDEAAVESLWVLAGLAARAGHAATLLRAATGRGALPTDFTVL